MIDCSEFIVMPPIGAAFDDPKWQARVGVTLSNRYPPYKFGSSSGFAENNKR